MEFGVGVAVWLVLGAVAGYLLFLNSSRVIVVASHESVVRPTMDGRAVLHTGPLLPDVRVSSGSRVGVDITLGRTEATSLDSLVKRYALLASQPEGQLVKVREALRSMAWSAALRGLAIGIVPVLVWWLVGPRRRRELRAAALQPRGGAVVAALAVVAVLAWQPWEPDDESTAGQWIDLSTFLGPEVTLPSSLDGVQLRVDVTTAETRRLVQSAIGVYDASKGWYDRAAAAAAELRPRTPQQGETVVALVSDRHDNIGMDRVARAIADAGGATAVFDAGDDTSTGNNWEAFSLDSVTAAFEDLPRWGVAGNHDHGTFVSAYLADHGWRMLDGTPTGGPGGSLLIGAADPRSSGLGAWRDETGLSFGEVADRLADATCASDARVTTMLVHDADLGAPALQRGCVDLVVGGHVHVQEGPTRVVAPDGTVGWSYTTGTTGGAAYAFAMGSKLKREAEVTLITYRDGRPVGLQPVTLQTNAVFRVSPYLPLTY